jgi:predicted aldo/keto reductase-like oxidoreductase
MGSLAQLEDNLAAADSAGPLSDEELAVYAQVRRAFRASYRIPCTGCNYCMPCHRHVNIPGCFAAYNATFAIGFVEGMKQYTTSTAATSAQRAGAGLCALCGECEAHCPQHLPIRKHLKEVRRRMEPWWFRAGLAIARLFLVPSRRGTGATPEQP